MDKEWFEYEEFEDYWNEYLTTEVRLATLDKLHKQGKNLEDLKQIWLLHKEVYLNFKELAEVKI